MAIANAWTKVDASKSMAETQQMLAEAGATSILIDYDAGEPAALSFAIAVRGQLVSYRLPANVDGMLAAMKSDNDVPRHLCKRDQARKVAWRVVKDWIRAQLALVEAGQARLAEVMLPYAVTSTGRTLYQELEDRGPDLLQLEAGEGGA